MILWPQSEGRAICTRACTRLRTKRNSVIAKPGEMLTGVSGWLVDTAWNIPRARLFPRYVDYNPIVFIHRWRTYDNASADPKGTRLPRCPFIQSQCRKFRLQRMPPSALSYGVCVLFCQCCYADAKDAVSVGHRPHPSKAKLVVISGNWMHRIECTELRPQWHTVRERYLLTWPNA